MFSIKLIFAEEIALYKNLNNSMVFDFAFIGTNNAAINN